MDATMLAALVRLAEARKAADLARLEALIAEDRALVREVAAAGAAPRLDLAEGAAATPMAQQGLRMEWAQLRVEQARRRQADLRRAIKTAREQAAQSLGKHEALEHLRERARAAERGVRDARAEREAPPEAGPLIQTGGA